MKLIPPWLRWLLVAILAGIVLLLAYPQINEFLQVDACLDAGGRWDAAASACVHG